MEPNEKWLIRLQQLIIKDYKTRPIGKDVLINDGFSEEFIKDAVEKGYLVATDNGSSFEMTEKLSAMPFILANAKVWSIIKESKFFMRPNYIIWPQIS